MRRAREPLQICTDAALQPQHQLLLLLLRLWTTLKYILFIFARGSLQFIHGQ